MHNPLPSLKLCPAVPGRESVFTASCSTQQSETWSGSWVHLPRVSCQGTCLLSREEWGLQYAYKGSSLSFQMGKWVSVASSKQFETVVLADWQFEEARFHQNLAHRRHITTQKCFECKQIDIRCKFGGKWDSAVLSCFQDCS